MAPSGWTGQGDVADHESQPAESQETQWVHRDDFPMILACPEAEGWFLTWAWG